MKFRGILKDCVRTYEGAYIFTIETKQGNLVEEDINALKTAKNGLKIDMCEYRQHRSLNANAFSWKIQDEIAKKIGSSIDEVHLQMVMEYGVVETYSIIKEALPSAIRMFDYYKILGESEANGKTFVHIRAGVGTHLYDSKEMARFIDGVVYEAKQLGIQTETPEEIARMKSLWRDYEIQEQQTSKAGEE